MVQSRSESVRRADLQSLKFLLSALASITWVVGAGVFVLQQHLPIEPGVARAVASLFLIASVGDGLVLYHWQRIFAQA